MYVHCIGALARCTLVKLREQQQQQQRQQQAKTKSPQYTHTQALREWRDFQAALLQVRCQRRCLCCVVIVHVLRAHVFYFILFVLFLGIQRVANVQVESAYRFVSSACIFACHSMQASVCVCVCQCMHRRVFVCIYARCACCCFCCCFLLSLVFVLVNVAKVNV